MFTGFETTIQTSGTAFCSASHTGTPALTASPQNVVLTSFASSQLSSAAMTKTAQKSAAICTLALHAMLYESNQTEGQADSR